MNNYDDIINYDYQMKHPRMSINNRSSQFAPFSALTGYSEMIREVERKTDNKKDLSNDDKETINSVIKEIEKMIKNQPLVTIKYFIKDQYKNGGNYFITQGHVRMIDSTYKKIILTNKQVINIMDIIDITINEKMD